MKNSQKPSRKKRNVDVLPVKREEDRDEGLSGEERGERVKRRRRISEIMRDERGRKKNGPQQKEEGERETH